MEPISSDTDMHISLPYSLLKLKLFRPWLLFFFSLSMNFNKILILTDIPVMTPRDFTPHKLFKCFIGQIFLKVP